MTSGDPLLDLERKNVILRLTDGEEIRGRLVSVRGDLLTLALASLTFTLWLLVEVIL